MTGPARPRSPRHRAWLVALAAPAALAAAPAALSGAPTIATDAICLKPQAQPTGPLLAPPLNVSGTGFTPNQSITITRGARQFPAVSDAAGNFFAQLSVLDLLSSEAPISRPVPITAADPVLGPSNALRIRTVPLEFSATPKRARPSQKVTFRLSGFNPDQVIYAHYRFKGRLRATVRMGRASNPCGLLTVRKQQIPVRDPQIGLWEIQFDHSKAFAPRAAPRFRATVNVFRTFRNR